MFRRRFFLTLFLATAGGALLAPRASRAEEEDSRAALERKLESTLVTMDFLETPVDAALDVLARWGEISIVRSPNADTSVPVSFRGEKMPLRRALRWITYLAGLDYAVVEQAVLVAPRDEIVRTKGVSATFDVRDLVAMAARDFPGPDLAGAAAGSSAIEFGGSEGGMLGEVLVELVKEMIEPGTWEDLGMSIDFDRGVLFVTHTKEAVGAVDTFLEELRTNATRLVSIEGTLYAVPADAWRDLVVEPATGLPRAVLDRDRWATARSALAEREGCRVVSRLATTCHSGQRVHVVGGQTRSYLADIDVQVAQGVAAADPVIGVLREGGVLDVRPIVSADGRLVKLTVWPQHVSPAGEASATYGPADSRPGSASPIEIALPATWSIDARTSAVIPDGGALLFSFGADLAGEREGEVYLQVYHATVVEMEE